MVTAVTFHPESRILIRPAIIEVDEENNETVVGMSTAIDVSFAELANAVASYLDEGEEEEPGDEEEEEEPQ